MDKESRAGLVGLSGNGWVAVLLLAAGALVFRDRPLEGSRPAADEPRLIQRQAVQEVDARLWQDPFGAVLRFRAVARERGGPDASASDGGTSSPLAELDGGAPASGRPFVLAVMVPGGPYAENVEARRRTRYAVLAALNTATFAPANTEHLGFFTPANAVEGDARLPDFIPFEWFSSARIPWSDDPAMRVLVLWLDADGFGDRPIAGLLNLMQSSPSEAPWQVLGPFGSDGLGQMLVELKASPPGITDDLRRRLHILSHAATVSDRAVLMSADLPFEPNKDSRAASYIRMQAGIRLTRTIGTDDVLADALVQELHRRGLKVNHSAAAPKGPKNRDRWEWYDALCRPAAQREDAPHQIALVGEWDTLYARSLHREFRIEPDNQPGFCVNRFSYVRGLDGQLPDQSAKPKSSDAPRSTELKDKGQRPAEFAIERAEGQGQFDYLRRLAAQLRERDRELRASHVDGAGIRAIGVVGNDVHDKLLVLQALQPEFPDAIFFTTDLDARLMHPREQAWARNLLVASNFGLRLRDELQVTAPPFRDSYQTSAYLSTLLAVTELRQRGLPSDEVLRGWLETPRVFEIGRTQAFDFSPREPPGAAKPRSCGTFMPASCPRIHPEGSRRYPEMSVRTVALVLSLGLFALWLPVVLFGRNMRRRFRRFIAGPVQDRRRGRVRRWSGVVSVLLVMHGLIPLLLARHWRTAAEALTRDGKPIAFLEGISIWPTEALQLATAVLCVYLVVHGWSALANNLDEIALALRTGKTRRQLVIEQDAIDRRLCPTKRLANMFRLEIPNGPPPRPRLVTDTRMSPQTLAFWRFYIVQNRTVSRAIRCAACVFAVVVVSCAMLWLLRQWPSMPQRGSLSVHAHWVIAGTAAIAMNFLVFGVADATLFCVRFVRDLRAHHANWPERSLKHFEGQVGPLPPRLMDHWIDLQFVARRTRTVTRLIYYPFIVLSLLLLSRSPVFDNWRMPPAVTFMAAVSIGVALGCAVALRRAAESSRALALQEFRHELVRVSSAASAPVTRPVPWFAFWRPRPAISAPEMNCTPEQLKLLMTQIENLREGAFAPFSQQPLLKAVLLPFATVGGTALIDLLALTSV